MGGSDLKFCNPCKPCASPNPNINHICMLRLQIPQMFPQVISGEHHLLASHLGCETIVASTKDDDIRLTDRIKKRKFDALMPSLPAAMKQAWEQAI